MVSTGWWNIAHTVHNSMAVLRDKFSGYLISKYDNFCWPPDSPDLSLCDSFCADISSSEYMLTSHAALRSEDNNPGVSRTYSTSDGDQRYFEFLGQAPMHKHK